jgi:hypothetical protein
VRELPGLSVVLRLDRAPALTGEDLVNLGGEYHVFQRVAVRLVLHYAGHVHIHVDYQLSLCCFHLYIKKIKKRKGRRDG